MYSDSTQREWGGVVAKIDKGSSYGDGAEEESLGEPISVGYFTAYSFNRGFAKFLLDGYKEVDSPLRLISGKFWTSKEQIGIYSIDSLTSATLPCQPTFTYKQYQLPTTSEIVLTMEDGFVPTSVESGGYSYSEGSGDDQWLHSAGTLTLKTTPSSAIQIAQEIYITGSMNIEIESSTSKVLTFKIEEDSAILGVEYLGITFTPARNIYAPNIGEYTVSEEGILNLYVSMGVALPRINPISPEGNTISKGVLSYPRPVQ